MPKVVAIRETYNGIWSWFYPEGGHTTTFYVIWEGKDSTFPKGTAGVKILYGLEEFADYIDEVEEIPGILGGRPGGRNPVKFQIAVNILKESLLLAEVHEKRIDTKENDVAYRLYHLNELREIKAVKFGTPERLNAYLKKANVQFQYDAKQANTREKKYFTSTACNNIGRKAIDPSEYDNIVCTPLRWWFHEQRIRIKYVFKWLFGWIDEEDRVKMPKPLSKPGDPLKSHPGLIKWMVRKAAKRRRKILYLMKQARSHGASILTKQEVYLVKSSEFKKEFEDLEKKESSRPTPIILKPSSFFSHNEDFKSSENDSEFSDCPEAEPSENDSEFSDCPEAEPSENDSEFSDCPEAEPSENDSEFSDCPEVKSSENDSELGFWDWLKGLVRSWLNKLFGMADSKDSSNNENKRRATIMMRFRRRLLGDPLDKADLKYFTWVNTTPRQWHYWFDRTLKRYGLRPSLENEKKNFREIGWEFAYADINRWYDDNVVYSFKNDPKRIERLLSKVTDEKVKQALAKDINKLSDLELDLLELVEDDEREYLLKGFIQKNIRERQYNDCHKNKWPEEVEYDEHEYSDMTFADRFKLAAFKAEDVKYKKKLKEDRDKDEEDSILKRFRREQRKKEQARKAYNNRSYSERFNEKSKYYKKKSFRSYFNFNISLTTTLRNFRAYVLNLLDSLGNPSFWYQSWCTFKESMEFLKDWIVNNFDKIVEILFIISVLFLCFYACYRVYCYFYDKWNGGGKGGKPGSGSSSIGTDGNFSQKNDSGSSESEVKVSFSTKLLIAFIIIFFIIVNILQFIFFTSTPIGTILYLGGVGLLFFQLLLYFIWLVWWGISRVFLSFAEWLWKSYFLRTFFSHLSTLDYEFWYRVREKLDSLEPNTKNVLVFLKRKYNIDLVRWGVLNYQPVLWRTMSYFTFLISYVIRAIYIFIYICFFRMTRFICIFSTRSNFLFSIIFYGYFIYYYFCKWIRYFFFNLLWSFYTYIRRQIFLFSTPVNNGWSFQLFFPFVWRYFRATWDGTKGSEPVNVYALPPISSIVIRFFYSIRPFEYFLKKSDIGYLAAICRKPMFRWLNLLLSFLVFPFFFLFSLFSSLIFLLSFVIGIYFNDFIIKLLSVIRQLLLGFYTFLLGAEYYSLPVFLKQMAKLVFWIFTFIIKVSDVVRVFFEQLTAFIFFFFYFLVYFIWNVPYYLIKFLLFFFKTLYKFRLFVFIFIILLFFGRVYVFVVVEFLLIYFDCILDGFTNWLSYIWDFFSSPVEGYYIEMQKFFTWYNNRFYYRRIARLEDEIMFTRNLYRTNLKYYVFWLTHDPFHLTKTKIKLWYGRRFWPVMLESEYDFWRYYIIYNRQLAFYATVFSPIHFFILWPVSFFLEGIYEIEKSAYFYYIFIFRFPELLVNWFYPIVLKIYYSISYLYDLFFQFKIELGFKISSLSFYWFKNCSFFFYNLLSLIFSYVYFFFFPEYSWTGLLIRYFCLDDVFKILDKAVLYYFDWFFEILFVKFSFLKVDFFTLYYFLYCYFHLSSLIYFIIDLFQYFLKTDFNGLWAFLEDNLIYGEYLHFGMLQLDVVPYHLLFYSYIALIYVFIKLTYIIDNIYIYFEWPRDLATFRLVDLFAKAGHGGYAKRLHFEIAVKRNSIYSYNRYLNLLVLFWGIEAWNVWDFRFIYGWSGFVFKHFIFFYIFLYFFIFIFFCIFSNGFRYVFLYNSQACRFLNSYTNTQYYWDVFREQPISKVQWLFIDSSSKSNYRNILTYSLPFISYWPEIEKMYFKILNRHALDHKLIDDVDCTWDFKDYWYAWFINNPLLITKNDTSYKTLFYSLKARGFKFIPLFWDYFFEPENRDILYLRELDRQVEWVFSVGVRQYGDPVLRKVNRSRDIDFENMAFYDEYLSNIDWMEHLRDSVMAFRKYTYIADKFLFRNKLPFIALHKDLWGMEIYNWHDLDGSRYFSYGMSGKASRYNYSTLEYATPKERLNEYYAKKDFDSDFSPLMAAYHLRRFGGDNPRIFGTNYYESIMINGFFDVAAWFVVVPIALFYRGLLYTGGYDFEYESDVVLLDFEGVSYWLGLWRHFDWVYGYADFFIKRPGYESPATMLYKGSHKEATYWAEYEKFFYSPKPRICHFDVYSPMLWFELFFMSSEEELNIFNFLNWFFFFVLLKCCGLNKGSMIKIYRYFDEKLVITYYNLKRASKSSLWFWR